MDTEARAVRSRQPNCFGGKNLPVELRAVTRISKAVAHGGDSPAATRFISCLLLSRLPQEHDVARRTRSLIRSKRSQRHRSGQDMSRHVREVTGRPRRANPGW